MSATYGNPAFARSGVQGFERLVETVLVRLNDPEAQAHPVLDEFEESIDLEGTDILHGWRRYPEEDACFSDAFSNAFRVMVLKRMAHDDLVYGADSRGQPVLRRVGCSGGSWVWEHTGTVTRWVVELSGEGGDEHTRLSSVESRLGEDLCFDSGAEAREGVRRMLAVGSSGCGFGCRVRAIEAGPDRGNGLNLGERT